MKTRQFKLYSQLRKNAFLFFLANFWFGVMAFGTTYTTVTNGNWYNYTTWDSNGIPPANIGSDDIININHNVTMASSYNLTEGTIVIGNGKTLTMGAGVVFTNGTGGTVLMSTNSELNFVAIGANYSNNGHLRGTGRIMGNFVNPVGGVVAPGHPAGDETEDFVFGGDFTNYGTLLFQFAGSNSPNYDHVGFSNGGNMYAYGTLTIELLNYSPLPNDAFDIVGGASGLVEDFETFNWPPGYTGNVKLPGNGKMRVELSISLPVELSAFNAVKSNEGVQLIWKTASEIDNRGFDIERSVDGETWNKLGFIPGHGTTNEVHEYFFLDEASLAGINYYRLRQFDFSGTESFSPIRSVLIKAGKGGVTMFPNPVRSEANLALPENASSSIVSVFNLLGQVVFEQKVDAGHQTLSLGSLNSGMYKVLIVDETGHSSTLTIEKI